jgi:hypothetical protein
VWGSTATAAAATYPVAPVVYVEPAPAAPAPVVSPDQAAAVAKLRELKSLQKQGLITEADYQAASQKLLSQIVQ